MVNQQKTTQKYTFRCPVCKSTDVETNTAYCWFMSCKKCGWFTNEYK